MSSKKDDVKKDVKNEEDQESQKLCWVKHDAKPKRNLDINRPTPRSGHTLSVIGINGFLFGGIAENSSKSNSDDMAEAAACNELYHLSLGSAGLEWFRIQTKGAVPLPRWHHTANLYDNTQLIIFGGFHTAEHRLNDVWIFDIVNYTWKQPNPEHNSESLVACPMTNQAWVNAPSPRGAHSATLIGDTLYIFGGYGGQGYSRRDLDDVYALNCDSWTWSKVQTKGMPPEKRSGHQACAIEKKIYIFGGWSSSSQFNDLFVLDTEGGAFVWSKLQSVLNTPTWNHASCSVVAIPTWKIFTFGGLTGTLSDHDRQGTLIDETEIMDTGTGTIPTLLHCPFL